MSEHNDRHDDVVAYVGADRWVEDTAMMTDQQRDEHADAIWGMTTFAFWRLSCAVRRLVDVMLSALGIVWLVERVDRLIRGERKGPA